MTSHQTNAPLPEPLIDLAPDLTAFRADVLAGLAQPQKRLPSKYFYDERGSRLFDRICELDEYYPTRTELAIMRAHAADMAACMGPRCLIIEYGSGSSIKTRILLDHAERPAGYAPLDVSRKHLLAASAALAAEYPHIVVFPICADFTAEYELPENDATGPGGSKIARRVVYFPGSTIGNFPPAAAQSLLAHIARVCGPGGGALVGIDLQKPVAVLEAAYNDAQGVTAAFNRNLLARINRELGGNFDLQRFAHRAFYDSARGCIEMHLESLSDQDVIIGDQRFAFRTGETIHTEFSYKYTLEGFTAMAARAGLEARQSWTDPDHLFAVVYLESARRERAA